MSVKQAPSSVDKNADSPFQVKGLFPSNDDYIKKIRKRMEEDALAREQREKRRRKVLVQQLKAHEAQEEAYREEQLVNRLMRQSQQERRIAVQLMYARHEKEVLRQNRIFREKQFEERRLQEFQDALDKEAALAKQARLDNEDEIRKQIELHDKIAAEHAEAKYRKHYRICQEILDQITDLATKSAEYRELTHNLIPAKLMREWKELYFNGKPLYEQASIDPLPSNPTPDQVLELEKLHLLDEQDYEEYQTMTGEWHPADECTTKEVSKNNSVLGHAVRRLLDTIYLPKVDSLTPSLPPFPMKACILGKLYAGKSTCLKNLSQAYHAQVLSVDTLVPEAIKAFHDSQVTENKLKTLDNEESDSKHLNTTIAQLGEKAEEYLKRGKCVPDELLVKLLMEAIRQVPQETGWIIDGFPVTLNQAKELEKALTGFDPEKHILTSRQLKYSSLVTDPRAPKDPPPPPPALDVVILLDISDTAVLKRAAEKNFTPEPFNQENFTASSQSPSTETENVTELKNLSFEPEPIQQRITGFLDGWPLLEEWYGEKQKILVKTNAEVPVEHLHKTVETLLLDAIFNKEKKAKEAITEELEKLKVASVPEPQPQVQIPPPVKAENIPPSTPPAKDTPRKGRADSRSPKGSKKSADSSKDKKGKDSAASSPKGTSAKGSKSRSTSREGSAKTKGGKKKSEPVTPVVPPEPVAAETLLPAPGSDEWEYVEETIPKEITNYLTLYWKTIVDKYMDATKIVLRNLRDESDHVIYHLADIRYEFKEYLKVPDHKQEFVSRWQLDYNSFADDIREDEETKAELHQRIDDLKECIWDICEKRKEEADQERNNIINDGWLPDHIGLLINHFSSLMQVEVDRFQNTCRLLRDYYWGMEGKIPDEISQEFTRIPLLDIINMDESGNTSPTKRIPVIYRTPQSPDPSSSKQKTRASSTKGKDDALPESPTVPVDPDDKLIIDNCQTAIMVISKMVTDEIKAKEEEDEKEQQQKELKEKEKQKAPVASSAVGKKKGQKSASKKKGSSSPAPAPQPSAPAPTNEEMLAIQKKQEIRQKMYKEFFAALQHEEFTTKSRLELIKSHALNVVQDLRARASQEFKDMEEWTGTRFLAEMESVNHLIEIARHHIESATKIQYELVLHESEFYINGDVKIFPDPIPPPSPPALETPQNGTLTIKQLDTLCQQFRNIAPSGFMSSKQFLEVMHGLKSTNLGTDNLPNIWIQLSFAELQELISVLALDSEIIDWHLFLMAASQPWPYPSTMQLLQLLHRFKTEDPTRNCSINADNYNKVEFWFASSKDVQATNEPPGPIPFDRLDHLRKFFFNLFADFQKTPAQLEYIQMLLYFAAHPDPAKGFYRALSIASGTEVHRKNQASNLLKSVPNIDQMTSDVVTEKETENLQADGNGEIALADLLRVVNHGVYKVQNSNRFSAQHNAMDILNEHIKQIYKELGSESLQPIALSDLLQHPYIQDLVENSHQYRLPDIVAFLQHVKQVQAEREIITANTNQ
ncbi:sperm flagellar protein 2 [Protopterus annectens]|uniref:sperm flagellar protein 2 n=1 Tax=Protopterus annectens TaxID=7888 RepID=UPI001CFAA719|nr:sperm flagellar protein 2 [Protopterus annectens]